MSKIPSERIMSKAIISHPPLHDIIQAMLVLLVYQFMPKLTRFWPAMVKPLCPLPDSMSGLYPDINIWQLLVRIILIHELFGVSDFNRTWRLIFVYLGTLAIISAYSRPQVCSRLLVKRDAEQGRYTHSNLCSAMWAERFLQMHDHGYENVYEDIKTRYLLTNPFS